MLAQCQSLTSAGIASLADNCGQLKMIDVAFTKVTVYLCISIYDEKPGTLEIKILEAGF